jgi:2-polyprenyl-6-methoxyphenol hydroxylase-like FAD-dependent oxidoreductase
MTKPRALVLGSGVAGILAAAALARHGYHVTIIEKDNLPAEPAPRKGIPQARHAHLLWSGGARAVEALLPGTTAQLVAAGAHYVQLPANIVSFSPQGWLRRYPSRQFLISCSRDLLDHVVRRHALATHSIEILEGIEVVGLAGEARQVTGVQAAKTGGLRPETIEAQLVVDATGRASRAAAWLADLGLPVVHEEVVDSGLAYATRIFKAPTAAATNFPVVNVQADPREPHPGKTANLLPIEGGRWLVTLSGTRGAEPSTHEDQFVPFAKSVRHPIVGDLIESAEPLSPVVGSRSTVNRRRRYEDLRPWPRGFVVIGDAVATYNPVYGHGMSVAAHSAAALARELKGYDKDTKLARRMQKAIARAIDPAWAVATSQDILYPGAIGKPPGLATKLLQRYVERVTTTGISRAHVAYVLLDAFSLSRPMTAILAPRVLAAAVLGPNRPPLDGPTLTSDELARVGATRKIDGAPS